MPVFQSYFGPEESFSSHFPTNLPPVDIVETEVRIAEVIPRKWKTGIAKIVNRLMILSGLPEEEIRSYFFAAVLKRSTDIPQIENMSQREKLLKLHQLDDIVERLEDAQTIDDLGKIFADYVIIGLDDRPVPSDPSILQRLLWRKFPVELEYDLNEVLLQYLDLSDEEKRELVRKMIEKYIK